jgi:hypothetical protein
MLHGELDEIIKTILCIFVHSFYMVLHHLIYGLDPCVFVLVLIGSFRVRIEGGKSI